MLKRKPIIDEDELRKLTEEMSMGVPEKEEEADEHTAGMTSTEEKHLWKEERESLRNKLIEEQVKGSAQDRDQRKEFAVKIFHFMCYYMVGAFAIVFLVGVECNRFHLSDSVLLMLLGTTTANVIGVFYFFAKYLFNKDK